MSTTPPALCIPQLSSVSFSAWHIACTQAATKCLPTNGPLGGLGLLLPDEEFALLNDGNSYVVAVRPQTVSNTNTSHQQMVFDREQIALGSLTHAIFDSIPLATKQCCPGYNATYGTSFIPLPSMMSHVRLKYGDCTVHAYQQARASLLRPFTGGDIDSYLAAHVEAHMACVRANNPLNEIEKVDALIAGVGGRSGPFGFTICQFEEDCSSLICRKFDDTPAIVAVPEIHAAPAVDAIDDQPAVPAIAYVPGHPPSPAREGLATRLRQAAPRVINASGVAAPNSHSFYGAAVTSPPTNLKAEITAILNDLLPFAPTDANAASTPALVTATTRRGRKEFYCWSHGLCGHAGKDCRNARVGHNPRATVSNRMGGSSKGCPK